VSDNHGSDRSLADHLSLTLALALALALALVFGLELETRGIQHRNSIYATSSHTNLRCPAQVVAATTRAITRGRTKGELVRKP